MLNECDERDLNLQEEVTKLSPYLVKDVLEKH